MKTACPLDCYDSCSVVFDKDANRLKGDASHPLTRGYLCPSLNSFLRTKRLEKPKLYGKEIELDEALDVLAKKIDEFKNSKKLFFKGSGNFGKMQDVSTLFFAEAGFDFTKGTLCDGAGEAGIIEGRGVSLSFRLSDIKKSEVVIVWGRDITNTNSHVADIIKDKTIIVIDPVKIDIVKNAVLHLQIRPRSDFFLAILLSRFALLEEMEDRDFIEKRCENFDYFEDFIRSFKIKDLINQVDIKVSEFISILEIIKDRRVSILVGVGVQKYLHGDSVLRAIDSFAALLGLFGKEGCGVFYLSDSSFEFYNPFDVKVKKVSKPVVDFGNYDFIFIQGANPVLQMPNSKKVLTGIKKAKFVVHFTLYEDETSKEADLIIPAKNFLEKQDVRFSYGHNYISYMPKMLDCSVDAISEYELTNFLNNIFSLKALLPENDYIKMIVDSNSENRDEYFVSKSYIDIPYSKRFYTDNKKFIFLDEVEDEEYLDKDGFFLITSKPKNSINSQFKREKYIYISNKNIYQDGDIVIASTKYGTSEFVVKTSDKLREDTIVIKSATKGVNYLTPDLKSNIGNSAVYQEVKVMLQKAK